MAISTLDVLRMKTQSFKNSLAAASEKVRKENVSTQLANSYNALVLAVSDAYPDFRSHLPARIESKSPFGMLGVSDAAHIDLEIYVDQLLGLLDLAGGVK